MLEAAMAFVDAYRLGDLASLVGLVVALVGFAITIRAARRARYAAEVAADAAQQARDQIQAQQSTTSLAGIVSRVEALKALHRNAHSEAQWRDMPERYSALRADLRQVRVRYPSLADDQRVIIQRSIETLAALEDWVERAVELGQKPANVARMNGRLARRSDELIDLLHLLQRRLEAGNRDD
jgi:hypothetical protein